MTVSKTTKSNYIKAQLSMLAVAVAIATNTTSASTLIVANTNDSSAGSLRAAVTAANSGDTITFAANLSGQTILFTSGQIVLTNNLTIDGSALASPIQLNGNHNSRFFNITNGVTLTLNSLVLTNGHGDFLHGGGAISSLGSVIMNNCTAVGNLSDGPGGAILQDGSLMILNGCAFANNIGNEGGGGIFNGGPTTINNCTFTGNSAQSGSDGGGILTFALLTLKNCTFIGNFAQGAGGGVKNLATLNVANCIVCSNTSASGGSNIDGSFVSGVTNLVDANPLLAPLGNYGGPTQTMPPLPGSPAIDAGDDSLTNSFATDQRGYPRLAGAHMDLGAVEGIYVAAGPGTLTGATRLGDGSIRFSFTNLTDASFPVLVTTNASQPISNWTQIGFTSETPAGSGQFQFTDPQATGNSSHRYYRVKSP